MLFPADGADTLGIRLRRAVWRKHIPGITGRSSGVGVLISR
jgi:hypothetical protein